MVDSKNILPDSTLQDWPRQRYICEHNWRKQFYGDTETSFRFYLRLVRIYSPWRKNYDSTLPHASKDKTAPPPPPFSPEDTASPPPHPPLPFYFNFKFYISCKQGSALERRKKKSTPTSTFTWYKPGLILETTPLHTPHPHPLIYFYFYISCKQSSALETKTAPLHPLLRGASLV